MMQPVELSVDPLVARNRADLKPLAARTPDAPRRHPVLLRQRQVVRRLPGVGGQQRHLQRGFSLRGTSGTLAPLIFGAAE